MSLLGDPFAQSHCLSDVQAPVQTQNSNLDDMMAVLVEQSGVQVRNEPPPSPIERLHREYSQLKAKQQRSLVPSPLAEDELNETITSQSSGKNRENVSLQDLVEREMKASRELEQRRSQSIEPGSQFRSQTMDKYRSQSMDPRGKAPTPLGSYGSLRTPHQSLAPLSSDFDAFKKSVSQGLAAGGMTQSVSSLPQSPAPLFDPTWCRAPSPPRPASPAPLFDPTWATQSVSPLPQNLAPRGKTQSGAPRSQTMAARRNGQLDRVDALVEQVNALQKEMENMEDALQQATEEATKLAEEKASCVKAHERDVAEFEKMLISVNAENKTLKEALSLAMEKNPHKLTPSGVPDRVERVMISTLIHSGISNMSSSPVSSGSVSTETPPSPQEDMEESGKSGDSNSNNSGTRCLLPPDAAPGGSWLKLFG